MYRHFHVKELEHPVDGFLAALAIEDPERRAEIIQRHLGLGHDPRIQINVERVEGEQYILPDYEIESSNEGVPAFCMFAGAEPKIVDWTVEEKEDNWSNYRIFGKTQLVPVSVLIRFEHSSDRLIKCSIYACAKEKDISYAIEFVNNDSYFDTVRNHMQRVAERESARRRSFAQLQISKVEAKGFTRSQAEKIVNQASPKWALRAVDWADELLGDLRSIAVNSQEIFTSSMVASFGESIIAGMVKPSGQANMLGKFLHLSVPRLSGEAWSIFMQGAEKVMAFRYEQRRVAS
jgi:hypothetical protein